MIPTHFVSVGLLHCIDKDLQPRLHSCMPCVLGHFGFPHRAANAFLLSICNLLHSMAAMPIAYTLTQRSLHWNKTYAPPPAQIYTTAQVHPTFNLVNVTAKLLSHQQESYFLLGFCLFDPTVSASLLLGPPSWDTALSLVLFTLPIPAFVF